MQEEVDHDSVSVVILGEPGVTYDFNWKLNSDFKNNKVT
jgi:hypothetical protein